MGLKLGLKIISFHFFYTPNKYDVFFILNFLKILYINIINNYKIVKNSGTSNSVLFIDNKPIYNSTSYNNTLHQPLFLGSNQEISTNSNVGGSVYYVNGYLVDEDYFD